MLFQIISRWCGRVLPGAVGSDTGERHAGSAPPPSGQWQLLRAMVPGGDVGTIASPGVTSEEARNKITAAGVTSRCSGPTPSTGSVLQVAVPVDSLVIMNDEIAPAGANVRLRTPRPQASRRP